MPITYGMNLAKSWGEQRWSGTVLMKAYTTYTEESEVFLSYHHADQSTALGLAKDLDLQGRRVFIDVHDGTLVPGDRDLDDALVTAISKSDTMIIIVSDETQVRFMVGALGDWRLDALPQTEGHVTSPRPTNHCRSTLKSYRGCGIHRRPMCGCSATVSFGCPA